MANFRRVNYISVHPVSLWGEIMQWCFYDRNIILVSEMISSCNQNRCLYANVERLDYAFCLLRKSTLWTVVSMYCFWKLDGFTFIIRPSSHDAHIYSWWEDVICYCYINLCDCLRFHVFVCIAFRCTSNHAHYRRSFSKLLIPSVFCQRRSPSISQSLVKEMEEAGQVVRLGDASVASPFTSKLSTVMSGLFFAFVSTVDLPFCYHWLI